MADSRRLVDKLWAYCDVLRDDGVCVLECTEQLTYLLFLKMEHERANRALAPERILPPQYDWQRPTNTPGAGRRIVDDLTAALAEFEAVAAALEAQLGESPASEVLPHRHAGPTRGGSLA